MFDIGVSLDRRVILIRFHGHLAESDLTTLDSLARKRSAGEQFDCIFDLTAVENVSIATEFIARRGELPQAFPNRERIYVVPQHDLKLLVRLYAAYQQHRGWRPPVIVHALDEALQRLDATEVDFRPVALPG